MRPVEGIDISVVIPTYGGEASLRELVERLERVLQARGVRFEIIIVNDASPDETWSVLSELSASHPELLAIDLMHRHGQALATCCGLAQARGDVVVTMDDDLQHPPEELPKLLDALAAEPRLDAVVGSWPRDEGPLRNLASWMHGFLDRLAHGTPRGYRHTAYRAMRRRVVDALLAHETRTPVLGPLLLQVSNQVRNVPVEHHPRRYGQSGFSIRQGLRQVWNNFVHGSALPLRWLSNFGLACALFATVLGTIYFVRALIGVRTPTGWASSFLAIVFFGGASLFGIGILGEYVHVIVREVRRPPRWVVRGAVGAGIDEDRPQRGPWRLQDHGRSASS